MRLGAFFSCNPGNVRKSAGLYANEAPTDGLTSLSQKKSEMRAVVCLLKLLIAKSIRRANPGIDTFQLPRQNIPAVFFLNEPSACRADRLAIIRRFD